MSTTWKTILIASAAVIAALALLAAGYTFGRSDLSQAFGAFDHARSPGWMGGPHPGMGHHPHWYGGVPAPARGAGRSRSGPGMGPWMHGRGLGPRSGDGGSGVATLSLEEASSAVSEYIEDLGLEGLMVGEIMIFENHAYAQILERETSVGALEVLVDPVTMLVYPEHGPTRMWNTKYSPMRFHAWMMGFGWRGWPSTDPAVETADDMLITGEESVERAQAYLDTFWPGLEADDHADRFYGYYTLHVLEAGEVTGMLSVNGYSGQVFPHTWHGELIEMSEHRPEEG